MGSRRTFNDAAHWYMTELTSIIVAKSGIPSDRFHLGKMLLECLRRYPDAVLQIDGATGEEETNASVLKRSILCANVMKDIGLQKGDVIILMAPNHLDLAIPFYAALYLGVIISAIDRTYGINELQNTFNISKPKMVFCQSEKAPDVQVALNAIDLSAEIITFDKGDYLCCFTDFLEKYDEDVDCEEFQANDFDAEDTTALLISTSGTTGLPKAAAVTHKNFTITLPHIWTRYRRFPSPTKMVLIGSPLQWLTALANFTISPIFGFIRLQSSSNLTLDHCVELFNKYMPTWTLMSPLMMTSLVKQLDDYNCDITSLESLLLGGSAVSAEIIQEIQDITPSTDIFNTYGMSEMAGIGFTLEKSPPGSSGKPMTCFDYRIIDVETGADIVEPNVPGELWVKGPGIFKEYYNNETATEETFAEDRWFRTGDMFYRDENNFYFFVDRIKLLLKYKSHQISPVELENVIRTHPGVLEVAVTGLPDPECGELPVACVVPKRDFDLDPEEIHQVVRDALTDSKHLRGGVIIVSELPLTPSSKINRKKLQEIVMNMKTE